MWLAVGHSWMQSNSRKDCRQPQYRALIRQQAVVACFEPASETQRLEALRVQLQASRFNVHVARAEKEGGVADASTMAWLQPRS
jgi:hypothetical protein